MSVETEVALVAFCIGLQGLFSGSEIAIVGSDRLVLRARAEGGDKAAERVLKLLERPARLVGTCLIGTNLATITGATVVANALARLGDVPELLVVAVYTPLTIVFAEMVPKSIFQQYANTLAPVVARPLSALATGLAPAIWAIEGATKLFMRLIGAKDAQVHAVRREDIQLLLDNATTGDIRAEEKEMILRVFHFSETLVADAMVPLIEVVGVAENATCAEARQAMIEHGFSRLPVFRKRIDRIVGIVMHYDLLFAPDPSAQVSSVMHEVMFVPETKRVEELFLDLRRKRQRLAVVVDEYGGAVGLISIEDILEEIVGEIEDEFDRRRPLVRRVGEREWLASGRVEGEDLKAITGFDMPEGDYETLAGFLLAQLGHVPAVGEKLTWGPFVFTVALANERAILEVNVVYTVKSGTRGV
ncbi:MAG: hemolysin family protein [Myxococcota bacterium]